MKIMITGATGFIGQNLAGKLAQQGHNVHALVRNPQQANDLQAMGVGLFNGDITDKDTIAQAMHGCEQVYHCAAFASFWSKNPGEIFKVNVEGTRNMLEQALQMGVTKFVYTSSTAVWGPNPYKTINEDDPRIFGFDNDYELSKHMAEQEVISFAKQGLDAVIVNPSRVYGPGKLSYSNAVTRMLHDALSGKMVMLPNGRGNLANYTFVHDVVEGHILAMQHGRTGERYILGGENLSYNELLALLLHKIGRVRILKMPRTLLKVLGGFEMLKSRITGKAPAFTPNMLDRYFVNMAFLSKKAEEELGYHITPASLGFDQTIDFIKRQMHE